VMVRDFAYLNYIIVASNTQKPSQQSANWIRIKNDGPTKKQTPENDSCRNRKNI
jgi:hypothetical protein